DLEAQDPRNSLEALEAARVLYPNCRGEPGTVADEVQLDFDLAGLLAQNALSAWAERGGWAAPADAAWQVRGGEPYDLSWPPPEKIRFLYEQIRALAPGHHSAALSLLAESIWLRQYHDWMSNYAVKWEGEKRVPVPYP